MSFFNKEVKINKFVFLTITCFFALPIIAIIDSIIYPNSTWQEYLPATAIEWLLLMSGIGIGLSVKS